MVHLQRFLKLRMCTNVPTQWGKCDTLVYAQNFHVPYLCVKT